MAKKRKRKAKTKTKTKIVNPTAKQIVRECKTEVNKGLGSKTLQRAARVAMEASFGRSVRKRLKETGANWAVEKRAVKKVARKFGRVAAVLSDTKGVPLWAAEAAYEAVKNDPSCPAAGPGSGRWCQ